MKGRNKKQFGHSRNPQAGENSVLSVNTQVSRTFHIMPGLENLHAQHTNDDLDIIPNYKELQTQVKKYISRNSAGNGAKRGANRVVRESISPETKIHYIHDKKSMRELLTTLNPEDSLVIHGDGSPVIVGFQEPSRFDMTAPGLAKLLKDYGIPNGVKIDCLSCDTATKPDTKTRQYNFAKDLSDSLCRLGIKDVSVSGYTGIIELKDNGDIKTAFAKQHHDLAREDIIGEPSPAPKGRLF